MFKLPNLSNINLKYLIGIVLVISVLIIAAALIFTFFSKAEKSSSLDTQPAAPVLGGAGQKPEKAMPAPTAPLAE